MSDISLVKNGRERVPHRCASTLRHRYLAIVDRDWSTISRMGRAFRGRVAEARQRARVYDELAAMSDPELQDIGISRADIPTVVFGTYHRPLYPVSNPTSNNWRVGVLIRGLAAILKRCYPVHPNAELLSPAVTIIKSPHRVRREGLSQPAQIAVLCTIFVFIVSIMLGLF